MADIAYKPQSPYNAAINTPPSKFPLESSLKLYGIKKVLYASVKEKVNNKYSTANLYKAEAGKILFITNCDMQLFCQHLAATIHGNGSILIGQTTLLYIEAEAIANTPIDSIKNVIYDHMPVTEDIDIQVYCADSNPQYTTFNVSIIGYEIDSSQLVNFY